MTRFVLDPWSNTPNDLTVTEEVVWKTSTLDFRAEFYELIFQVNSNEVSMKIEIDGDVVMPYFSLEALRETYRLRNGNLLKFSIMEYDSKRWAFIPPKPLKIDTSMKIYMKANAGTNKRLEWGLSVWGQT